LSLYPPVVYYNIIIQHLEEKTFFEHNTCYPHYILIFIGNLCPQDYEDKLSCLLLAEPAVCPYSFTALIMAARFSALLKKDDNLNSCP